MEDPIREFDHYTILICIKKLSVQQKRPDGLHQFTLAVCQHGRSHACPECLHVEVLDSIR